MCMFSNYFSSHRFCAPQNIVLQGSPLFLPYDCKTLRQSHTKNSDVYCLGGGRGGEWSGQGGVGWAGVESNTGLQFRRGWSLSCQPLTLTGTMDKDCPFSTLKSEDALILSNRWSPEVFNNSMVHYTNRSVNSFYRWWIVVMPSIWKKENSNNFLFWKKTKACKIT